VILKNHSDLGTESTQSSAIAGSWYARHANVSGTRFDQPVDAAKQRGFPSPRWTEHHQYFTGRYVEANIG
jgi:hypothetical protein